MRYTARTAACVAVLLVASACSRQPGPVPAARGEPRIELNRESSGSTTVDVVGLPVEALARLERAALTGDQWTALLRVEVAASGSPLPDRPAVLGAYAVSSGIVRFTPQFPFDPGQRYTVAFDPARLPSGAGTAGRRITTTLDIPALERSATTKVIEVYPSGREVPENQLRMYVSFSAPMGLEGGSRYLHLVDDRGRTVEDPFLPLDVNLWNEDRTRYTVLFDPGRVKRGILPNEEMGRAMIAGRRYTLVVDAGWRDAAGQPLAASFRRDFHVGGPEEHAIDPDAWRLDVPRRGTRDRLIVSFPRPLDYGLLQRAIRVSSDRGDLLDGAVTVEDAETRWIFTPHAPWQGGEYRLLAASTLEDVAGNRIGRPFEVDVANEQEPPRASNAALAFTIK